MSNSSNYYKQRIQHGLCGRCGKNAHLENQVLCKNCVEYQYFRRKSRIKHNKCKCGAILKNHKTLCDVCLLEANKKTKIRRNDFKNHGLCQICGNIKTVEKSICDTCRKKRKDIQVFRKNNGLCKNCGKETLNNKKRCDICINKTKELKEQKITNNICPICGQQAKNNKVHCTDCLLKTRKTSRQKYNKSIKNKKCVICGVRIKNDKRKCVYCRLVDNLRRRINEILTKKATKKRQHTIQLVGCTFQELCDYLELRFQKGMTWENYGRNGWHVDHVKPLSLFDLTTEEEQRKAFHYTNLQPLWAKDNLRKSNKYEQ